MSKSHTKWLATACAVSAALHVCALGALAAWSVDRWARQSHLGASPGVVVFQASFSEPEPQPVPVPVVEFTAPQQQVLISPDRATAVSRRFVNVPSADVPLEEFLTREVLDRLLESQPEEVASTVIAEKESIALEMAFAPAQEQPVPRQPTAERRPATKVNAVLHKARPTPQTDAGLRTGPSFAGNRPPTYPSAARRNGWQGQVMLRLHISAAGAVTLVEVESSSGYEILDAEAVATVRTWRGTPATLNGEPVATIERLPVIFRLP